MQGRRIRTSRESSLSPSPSESRLRVLFAFGFLCTSKRTFLDGPFVGSLERGNLLWCTKESRELYASSERSHQHVGPMVLWLGLLEHLYVFLEDMGQPARDRRRSSTSNFKEYLSNSLQTSSSQHLQLGYRYLASESGS